MPLNHVERAALIGDSMPMGAPLISSDHAYLTGRVLGHLLGRGVTALSVRDEQNRPTGKIKIQLDDMTITVLVEGN